MIPFASETAAKEYYPSASSQPARVVTSVLKDASDIVGSVAPMPESRTRIVEALTAASTQVYVEKLQALLPEGFVQIGDERITYTGRTHTEGAGYLTGLTRGTFNTAAQAHPIHRPLQSAPLDYADRRERAELRAFAYYIETSGFVHTERVQGVGSTRYTSNLNLKNLIKAIMGRTFSRRAVPIV